MTKAKNDLDILADIRKHKTIGRKKGGGKKQHFIKSHFEQIKGLRDAGASWDDISKFIKIKYGKTIHLNTIRREYLKLTGE